MSTIENNIKKEFKCLECNKNYKDKSGLWYHNKKYHENKVSSLNQPINNVQPTNKTFKCNFCDSTYKHKQSRFKHEKICNKNKSTDNKQSEIYNKQNIIITNLTNEIERLKADFKIILNGSPQPNQTNETTQPTQTKKSIPIAVKRLVWNKYIGEDIGKSKCYCCKLSHITQLTFHCGHVIAEKNGGNIDVDNLRPICQSCNSSMGTHNMDNYIAKYSLHKTNNIEL